MNIILWIISAFLQAVWGSQRKKAIDNSNLPTSLFAILGPIMGALIIFILIIFLWVNKVIYSDYIIIILIWLVTIFELSSNYIEVYVFKRSKLSDLLPYRDANKIIIILLWFFIYYGTTNSTSITTFFITIFTFLLILWFSFDFKNLKINKNILMYLVWKILSASSWLLIWYILFIYTTIEYMSINVIFAFLLYFSITILKKDSFSTLLKQNKQFYKSRISALILWWTWFIIWLYVIKSSWLLVATLIWFTGLVFNIASMRFILNDIPSKKQVLLAILVSILIWIWYYFK